jgi:hypothetical protein
VRGVDHGLGGAHPLDQLPLPEYGTSTVMDELSERDILLDP